MERECAGGAATTVGLCLGAVARGVLTGKYRHGTPPELAGRRSQLFRVRYVEHQATDRAEQSGRHVVTAADGWATARDGGAGLCGTGRGWSRRSSAPEYRPDGRLAGGEEVELAPAIRAAS